ncbi:hypothetical protein PAPYR_13159 [Paratrimastix pyriformis]|uniref:Uncharacterized protein n=1 Tax=Paratrimastix pyriformis TaxID=342808 RepID=A0ABQ8U493_9EUKA|nr:hypothetical protein PAPYR_13159 [Paratrimastix pyriformis]
MVEKLMATHQSVGGPQHMFRSGGRGGPQGNPSPGIATKVENSNRLKWGGRDRLQVNPSPGIATKVKTNRLKRALLGHVLLRLDPTSALPPSDPPLTLPVLIGLYKLHDRIDTKLREAGVGGGLEDTTGGAEAAPGRKKKGEAPAKGGGDEDLGGAEEDARCGPGAAFQSVLSFLRLWLQDCKARSKDPKPGRSQDPEAAAPDREQNGAADAADEANPEAEAGGRKAAMSMEDAAVGGTTLSHTLILQTFILQYGLLHLKMMADRRHPVFCSAGSVEKLFLGDILPVVVTLLRVASPRPSATAKKTAKAPLLLCLEFLVASLKVVSVWIPPQDYFVRFTAIIARMEKTIQAEVLSGLRVPPTALAQPPEAIFHSILDDFEKFAFQLLNKAQPQTREAEATLNVVSLLSRVVVFVWNLLISRVHALLLWLLVSFGFWWLLDGFWWLLGGFWRFLGGFWRFSVSLQLAWLFSGIEGGSWSGVKVGRLTGSLFFSFSGSGCSSMGFSAGSSWLCSISVPFVDAEKHSVTLGEIIETIPAKATVAKALVNARLDFDRLMGKPVALIQLLKMIGPFFATESADVETPTPPAVGILGDSTKTIIAQSLIDSVEDSLRECDQVVSWVSSRVRSHTPGGEPTERLARTSSRLADLLPAVALLQQCAFIGALNRSFLHMLAHCLQSVCLLAKAIGIVGVLPDEFRALVTTFSQTSSGLLEKNINETDVTKREMEALPNVRYHMEQLLRVLNQIGQKHKVWGYIHTCICIHIIPPG